VNTTPAALTSVLLAVITLACVIGAVILAVTGHDIPPVLTTIGTGGLAGSLGIAVPAPAAR